MSSKSKAVDIDPNFRGWFKIFSNLQKDVAELDDYINLMKIKNKYYNLDGSYEIYGLLSNFMSYIISIRQDFKIAKKVFDIMEEYSEKTGFEYNFYMYEQINLLPLVVDKLIEIYPKKYNLSKSSINSEWGCPFIMPAGETYWEKIY